MAVPLQVVRRCFLLSRPPNSTLSRSAFILRSDDPSRPNGIRVSLTVLSTIAIWIMVIKDRNEHLAEYERRKSKREAQ